VIDSVYEIAGCAALPGGARTWLLRQVELHPEVARPAPRRPLLPQHVGQRPPLVGPQLQAGDVRRGREDEEGTCSRGTYAPGGRQIPSFRHACKLPPTLRPTVSRKSPSHCCLKPCGSPRSRSSTHDSTLSNCIAVGAGGSGAVKQHYAVYM
jgi:hypothetical protein